MLKHYGVLFIMRLQTFLKWLKSRIKTLYSDVFSPTTRSSTFLTLAINYWRYWKPCSNIFDVIYSGKSLARTKLKQYFLRSDCRNSNNPVPHMHTQIRRQIWSSKTCKRWTSSKGYHIILSLKGDRTTHCATSRSAWQCQSLNQQAGYGAKTSTGYLDM